MPAVKPRRHRTGFDHVRFDRECLAQRDGYAEADQEFHSLSHGAVTAVTTRGWPRLGDVGCGKHITGCRFRRRIACRRRRGGRGVENPPRRSLLVLARFEYGEEGFLRDFDLAELPHPLLTLALFGPQFTLSGDIAAIAFCGDVFAQGGDGFAGNDLPADGGLQGDLKLMF